MSGHVAKCRVTSHHVRLCRVFWRLVRSQRVTGDFAACAPADNAEGPLFYKPLPLAWRNTQVFFRHNEVDRVAVA